MGAKLLTAEHCRRLRALGVIKEQIEALENVLPACPGYFASPARMTDVRAELSKLRKALRSIHTPTGAMRSARDEVHARILLAEYQAGAAPDSLGALLAAVERAAADLQSGQRRRRASPMPVAFIDRALLDGWGKRYAPFTQSRPRAMPERAPAYPFAPSSGAGSPFYEVVAICFEALGNASPDQAIRAFIRQLPRT